MRPRIYYYYPPTQRRGIRFGREELRDIALAVGALTLAFSLMWMNPIGGGPAGWSAVDVAFVVGASFIAVITGFLMHELAHKVVAVRYGMWAEFRADQRGLLLSVVTALFGIVLAAPGAVMIAGPVNLKQNGKISLAGPLTNLGFGGGFFGLLLLMKSFHAIPSGFILVLILELVSVNLILGVFNMIPVPPLDGSKIWRWKKPLWIGVIATFIVMLVYFLFFFTF